MSTDHEQYERYASDMRVLQEIGAALEGHASTLVKIPELLADSATTAWARDEVGDLATSESVEQTVLRHAAGDLALIGLAITERGERRSDGQVEVEIAQSLIDAAIDAAGRGSAR